DKILSLLSSDEIISLFLGDKITPLSPDDEIMGSVDQQSFLLAENTVFIKFLQELDPVIISYITKHFRLGLVKRVTTNNTANILAMGCVLKEKMNNEFRNQNVQHFHCGAHVLNIIVEEEIKSISKEISKAWEFSMKL
ncbi:3180_t:CDS:2, partial [Racocetra persica]